MIVEPTPDRARNVPAIFDLYCDRVDLIRNRLGEPERTDPATLSPLARLVGKFIEAEPDSDAIQGFLARLVDEAGYSPADVRGALTELIDAGRADSDRLTEFQTQQSLVVAALGGMVDSMGPDGGGKFIHGQVVDATNSGFAVEAKLRTASPRLYWVDGPMLELAAEVAEKLPDDTKFEDIDAPSAAGFVVFGERLYAIDAVTGEATVPLDGMAWVPTRISADHGTTQRMARSYLALHRTDRHPVNIRGDGVTEWIGEAWVPLGRSDWCVGDTIDTTANEHEVYEWWSPDAGADDPVLDAQQESAAQDRRLMAALWMLMGQERAADVSRWEPNSKAAKRRHKDRVPSVVVVHLRRDRGDILPGDGEAGESTVKRKYRHRWFVAPHPRWQAYGPGMKQRKLILVDGYVKGPGDAPFIERKRVWSLDR